MRHPVADELLRARDLVLIIASKFEGSTKTELLVAAARLRMSADTHLAQTERFVRAYITIPLVEAPLRQESLSTMPPPPPAPPRGSRGPQTA